MDLQPATEDPRSRLKTRRPVETTARTVGSGIGRPVTHLKQTLGQCLSGKCTSARCCLPGGTSPNLMHLAVVWLGERLTGARVCPLYVHLCGWQAG